MQTRTENGRRPDLEGLEVNWPVGYVGTAFFPVSTTREKANSFTFRQVVADAGPEEDRSWSTALTQTRITNGNAEYSCKKQEKRYVLTEEDAKEVGGIEVADKVGAEAATRSVMRKHESDAYAKVFSSGRRSAAIELAAGKEFAGITKAADDVRRVVGDLSLVCSKQWFMAFIGLQGVTTRLQSVAGLGAYVQARDAALALRAGEVVLPMLSSVLPFDKVVIGDDDPWRTYAKYAAVAMLPRVPAGDDMAAVIAAKTDPIYGMTKMFLPDPASENPYRIDSFYLTDTKVNAYDSLAMYDLVELNAAGVKLVKLPGEQPFTG